MRLFRRWLDRRWRVKAPYRRPLGSVLAEVPGLWVAVDRVTNEPRAVADTPDKLTMKIREQRLRNITVVRAPDPSEPELVGLG